MTLSSVLYKIPVFVFSLLLFLSTGCQETDSDRTVTYTIPEQPELATGYNPKPGWEISEFAVAAANPLAADAGYQILKAGGSAVDAAIAVQMVLTLAEPQSSGIGGGAFLMHWDGTELKAYNGRETAPSSADETLFLDKNGDPLAFSDAVHSGLAVGVPGTLAMLKAAHDAHGQLPWDELFQPAITLAEEGFSVSHRLHEQLAGEERLTGDDIARSLYFDDNGDPHPVGYNLQNPALAQILRNVSSDGIDTFYGGDVAEDIVARIQNHPRPGTMSVEDIRDYPEQDFETDAICTPWNRYRICGFPPPSSGHLTIMQILGIMEHLESPAIPLQDFVPTADWLHQFLETSKLAFADRNRFIADPGYVDPPGESWESMLDSEYLAERASLVGESATEQAEPGKPGRYATLFGSHPAQTEKGTSHISIVDREGNALSMTSTIEQGFGSRIMSDGGTGLPGGFHLNNELTDFSRIPIDEHGQPIANRVEPGKRPRSSMSPTLIFKGDTGEFAASVGSPGGAAIIHYTAKTIIGMYDWGLNAQEAIDLPNFANYNTPSSLLEESRFPQEVIEALQEMGHEISERELTSGIQAIQRIETGFFGGADPRREGIVMGD